MLLTKLSRPILYALYIHCSMFQCIRNNLMRSKCLIQLSAVFITLLKLYFDCLGTFYNLCVKGIHINSVRVYVYFMYIKIDFYRFRHFTNITYTHFNHTIDL